MSGATDIELMSGGLRKKERSHQSQGSGIFWVLWKKTKLSIRNAIKRACINLTAVFWVLCLGRREVQNWLPCHGPRQNGLFGRKWGMIFTCRLKTSKQSRSPINYLEFTPPSWVGMPIQGTLHWQAWNAYCIWLCPQQVWFLSKSVSQDPRRSRLSRRGTDRRKTQGIPHR